MSDKVRKHNKLWLFKKNTTFILHKSDKLHIDINNNLSSKQNPAFVD